MQLPTINSQNCFRAACLVIYLFLHTCVGDWEEKHQPHRMLSACHTQCQPGGLPAGPRCCSPAPGPGQPACTAGRGWHLGGEECWGGWDVLLCQWESPGLWGSLWSTRKALGEHPQAGHTGGTLLNSFNVATSHRSHWNMELELSFLTASGKINVLILRVSFLQWTFPCWAGVSISCCHRAEQLLSLGPIFPCLE